MLRVAGRDFTRALADADTVAEGPLRELWAARDKGWVGNAELAEINRMLMRIDDAAASAAHAVAQSSRRAVVDPGADRREARAARDAREALKFSHARGRRARTAC